MQINTSKNLNKNLQCNPCNTLRWLIVIDIQRMRKSEKEDTEWKEKMSEREERYEKEMTER